MGNPPYAPMAYPSMGYSMPYVSNYYYPPNFSPQSSMRTGNSASGYGSYPAPEAARTGSSKERMELPHPAGDVKVRTPA
jgi:hypothetical protein